MLIDALDSVRPFMEFLNSQKLCSVPCRVVLLLDACCVINQNNGDVGFAGYCIGTNAMYIAGDMSGIDDLLTEEDQMRVIITSIAHEYIHHIQNVERREFDEKEAEEGAEELVNEFFKKLKVNVRRNSYQKVFFSLKKSVKLFVSNIIKRNSKTKNKYRR